TFCCRRSFNNLFSQVFPEVNELVVTADELNVERGGELGKSLAHPLIVIAIPTDDVPPPLVRNFVRSYIAPEIIGATARAEQLSALRGVNERQVRHVNERGPCLTK